MVKLNLCTGIMIKLILKTSQFRVPSLDGIMNVKNVMQPLKSIIHQK